MTRHEWATVPTVLTAQVLELISDHCAGFSVIQATGGWYDDKAHKFITEPAAILRIDGDALSRDTIDAILVVKAREVGESAIWYTVTHEIDGRLIET